MTDPSIVAQGYGAAYAAMPRSPTLLRIRESSSSPGHPSLVPSTCVVFLPSLTTDNLPLTTSAQSDIRPFEIRSESPTM